MRVKNVYRMLYVPNFNTTLPIFSIATVETFKSGDVEGIVTCVECGLLIKRSFCRSVRTLFCAQHAFFCGNNRPAGLASRVRALCKKNAPRRAAASKKRRSLQLVTLHLPVASGAA